MQESDNVNVQHTLDDPPVECARAPVLYQGHSLAEKTMEQYGHPRDENPNGLPITTTTANHTHMTCHFPTLQVGFQ